MNPARLAAAALVTLGTACTLVLAGSPAYAEWVTVTEHHQVPVAACADVPVDTPGITLTVGGQTVRVPVIDDVRLCAAITATVYADFHGFPTAWTACLYGPAAYSEGSGASVTDALVGASFTTDGTPNSGGAFSPGAGYDTGYWELLNSGYGFARCP